MAYVVQEPCVGCKYGDCIEECPVDAFHQGDDMLYINPDTCIDCHLCVPACPVNAIVSGDDADEVWAKKNAEFDFLDSNMCLSSNGRDSIDHGPNWNEELAI